jgi:hypothetical protein
MHSAIPALLGPTVGSTEGPGRAGIAECVLAAKIFEPANTWFVVHVDFAKIKQECSLG